MELIYFIAFFFCMITTLFVILTPENEIPDSTGARVLGGVAFLGAIIFAGIITNQIFSGPAYKEGQMDALKGINNLEIKNTYVDSTLVKSDTVFVEGFKYY